jgi:hypothetical protein
VWRPLSQRIRESAPIRLIADNRFVRKITDKPVTKAPARRQAVLIGLIPALTATILLVSGFLAIAFYPDSVGGLLALTPIGILLFGGLLIGRRLRSVICTILASGLCLVFVTSGAVRVVSDLVLQTRGEEVTAVVDDYITNPTGCAAISAFHSRLTSDSIATSVHSLDGTPLPGAIGFGERTHGNDHTYRKGERVQVVVDPENAVCMRAKSDVHLVIDAIIAVLAIGCVAWVFIVAPLDWRVRRLEKYETWRNRAS